ncbi:MAG TPA: HD domain-containing phosphohydrolase, partial [Spirochaetota bacterium]|nr:HD domain-containing phosphohydrolase [Spirochaetota bacterium]
TRNIFKASTVIALQHHEKFNGSGYPLGLKGEEIHIYSRITAVADVFDALSHSRVYREAWDISKVVDFFKKESGNHFDPKIVEVLITNIDEILKINDKFSS